MKNKIDVTSIRVMESVSPVALSSLVSKYTGIGRLMDSSGNFIRLESGLVLRLVKEAHSVPACGTVRINLGTGIIESV